MGWRSLAFLGIARSDENSQTDPSRLAGLDVAYFVSQDRGLSRIEVKVGHGLQDHTRVGFAPGMIAAVLADAMEGVIRAVVYASDRRVFRFKAFTHPSRQVCICALIEIATTDARLVGDDNDRPMQFVGPKAGQFENSRNELELVRPMGEATVNIDHAVAVQKKCTAVHTAIFITDGCSVLNSSATAQSGDSTFGSGRGLRDELRPQFLVGQQLIKICNGARKAVLKHCARLPIEQVLGSRNVWPALLGVVLRERAGL